ncbi:N-6 DNA methylase [Saccharospirillum sp.]|uniref:Eco57I restriction-modification methylase domain-containing protein n=1 Tax=Saccharospirillum sp. TaxID=2033801 RepID=UPI00349FDA9F
MKRIHKTHAALNLPSLRLEGALFLPDQLEKAALGQATLQTEADYHTPKGLKLKDDYSRAFQIANAQWQHVVRLFERTDTDPQHATTTFVQELLRDAFAYHSIQPVAGLTLGERHYPIDLLSGQLPIVVAPHHLGLDTPDERFSITDSGSRKKTAFQLAQEFLNASNEHLWAIVTNGKQLRLLRDAATLTRPSFLEIDLQDLLSGQRFAEFAMAWRLLHASRAGQASEPPEACVWEAWREAGKEEGTRVREGMRKGVTQALLTLGSGFLQHPANDDLRRDLQDGNLSKDDYFQQLLRLIYRLIFLFTVEERGLLHPADNSNTAQQARRAYAEGYAMARLRDRALKRRARNRFDDLWQSACIVFKGLNKGESRLALPALGGLFASSQCPALDAASLNNTDWLLAIQHLRWDNASGSLAPVDYRNMGPEELGSVYESLLELVPEVELPARLFGFAGLTSDGSTQGNARKTSGSYYTPDSLVQELIKSALDPVIEQRLADNPADPTGALLNIKVIDPACGSGHFLLAAARRLAEQLAALRSTEGAVKPQDYRHALREVISHCIFGVDRNPMALELCRTALWLEGFEEGRPLSFLDHHLQCGDALLGLTDLKALEKGIAPAAFKPLSGDDKAICKQLAQLNKAALKDLEKKRIANAFGQLDEIDPTNSGLTQLQALEALPEDTPQDIAKRAATYQAVQQQVANSRWAHAADLLLGAFVLPKTETTAGQIPTSQTLFLELFSDQHNAQHQLQLQAARNACRETRVLHWPLAFPQVFAKGGFDCVLANPPWERIKLQEEEFFATRSPMVATAKNKAERSQRIDWLAQGQLAKHIYPDQEHSELASIAEQRLYKAFLSARRTAEAASSFAHVKRPEGGRYPLTGVGDVNTYALFAESISQITHTHGRAGFIVPSGIATDDSTKHFFSSVVTTNHLVSFYGFDNAKRIFPAVHPDTPFALVTLGHNPSEIKLAHYILSTEELNDPRRIFTLEPKDFPLINPNTLTCPVFRARHDAELARQIYQRVPVLIRDACGSQPEQNPWGISFMRMFDMSNDSHLFFEACNEGGNRLLPLYEAKMIHQFDHRWATYEARVKSQAGKGDMASRDVTAAEKADREFSANPRYWVSEVEVRKRLADKCWGRQWLLGWRDITNATNGRTVIASIAPVVGVGHTMPILFSLQPPAQTAGLLANLSSLVLDFIARVKVGGTHLTYGYLKQFPVLPPEFYTKTDLDFIIPRVLELTYTAWDMEAWAQDLGYDGGPFAFNSERRAILRAELDAWYARAYGLNREQLRYILDPADIEGPDYPSETFRVLQKNDLKNYGEYRTQRLVLEAWDRLHEQETSQDENPYRIAASQSDDNLGTAPDECWMRPNQDQRAEIGVQLIALLNAAKAPLPIRQMRIAVALAMEPRLMLPLLDEHKADEWQRLVGDEARPLARNMLALPVRSNQEWGAAVRHLRTTGYLIENQKDHTWEPGQRTQEFPTPVWANGRASWVLEIVQSLDTPSLLTQLPEETREWINAA